MMKFSHSSTIAHSKEWHWFWTRHVESFSTFPNKDVYGGEIDFSKPLDFFDIDSKTAEKLRKIGKEYDLFDNPLPISIPELELLIFDGFNDEDGIGSILWQFTNKERERACYGIYASLFKIENSIYCALTICFTDKDTAEEMPVAILEIGQDEGPFVSPVLINDRATELFTFDDMQALAEYIANVWFGIQYELYYCPDEIRVVDQRGPIEPDGEYHKPKGIVYVKKIIPIDENGNPIKYEAQNSGRQYTMPAWNVRSHPRQLPDGRIVQVRAYPKGKERNNPDAIVPKQYIFDDEKVNDDTRK